MALSVQSVTGWVASNYKRFLRSFLPRGAAWNKNPDSVIDQFLSALAEELARIDARSYVLRDESDPRLASELLLDHERDLGLPNECTELGVTIQERRAAAYTQTIALGKQTKAYFIEIAAAFGYTITITEYTPFWSGVGVSGDPAGDQHVLFYWTVNIDSTVDPVLFLSGASESGDSLQKLAGYNAIGCLIQKYKPAHTIVNSTISGPDFSIAFGDSFDSIPSDALTSFSGAFSGYPFSSAFDVLIGGAFSKDAFDSNFVIPL